MAEANQMTDVLMALLTLAIQEQTAEHPELRPELERESSRRFAWKYSKSKFLVTVTGPFPTR